MNVTLLCKVVDNYGDIGFVYRLARTLRIKYPQLNLSIVVSNLDSFAAMAPEIKNIPFQKYLGMDVLDWNNADECKKYFSENPVELILECFQCGRPEWLDEILFDKTRTDIVQIVNVEYLTAESWADDFHLLKSGTRSALVKKMNFMPGFTNKTGGLVLDNSFMENLENKNAALKKLEGTNIDSIIREKNPENNFFATVFAYTKNLEPLVTALKNFQEQQRKKNPDFNLTVFAASGLSFNSVNQEWEKLNKPFELIPLPYLRQESWDALLTLCDFNFIRGEDSFSRACLCGKPFLWNAYVQDEEFQLVKVRAVVDLMKKFFIENNQEVQFENFRNAMMIYNVTPNGNSCAEAEDSISDCPKNKSETECICELLLDVFETKKTFQTFSQSLINNGDLTEKLEIFFRN